MVVCLVAPSPFHTAITTRIRSTYSASTILTHINRTQCTQFDCLPLAIETKNQPTKPPHTQPKTKQKNELPITPKTYTRNAKIPADDDDYATRTVCTAAYWLCPNTSWIYMPRWFVHLWITKYTRLFIDSTHIHTSAFACKTFADNLFDFTQSSEMPTQTQLYTEPHFSIIYTYTEITAIHIYIEYTPTNTISQHTTCNRFPKKTNEHTHTHQLMQFLYLTFNKINVILYKPLAAISLLFGG